MYIVAVFILLFFLFFSSFPPFISRLSPSCCSFFSRSCFSFFPALDSDIFHPLFLGFPLRVTRSPLVSPLSILSLSSISSCFSLPPFFFVYRLSPLLLHLFPPLISRLFPHPHLSCLHLVSPLPILFLSFLSILFFYFPLFFSRVFTLFFLVFSLRVSRTPSSFSSAHFLTLFLSILFFSSPIDFRS